MKFALRTNRSRGFTIIELMITLVITSVLILGSITFLMSARKSNQVQLALSELGSSGRFGLDQIARDLRMSGYRESDWTIGPLDTVVMADDRESEVGGDTLSISYEGFRDCTYAQRWTGVDNDGDGVDDGRVAGIVLNVYQVGDGELECNCPVYPSDASHE